MSENWNRQGPSRSERSEDSARFARERTELLAQYRMWRSTLDEQADIDGEVATIEALLRLKHEQLASPEPGLWTKELTAQLLTEVVPRKVIQPREEAMSLVPVLSAFFGFLRDGDHWHTGSMPTEEAQDHLSGLEFEVLEAADDPSRRSFSTNILTYGLERGLDPTDEDALAAYMTWYNDLPDDDRVELSDTGRLREPSVPYDPATATATASAAEAFGAPVLGVPDPGEDGNDAGSGSVADGPDWPWFLPATGLSLEAATELWTEGTVTDYEDNDLVVRASALLELIGQGRAVTDTGALRRRDANDLLERLGSPRPVRSMWDADEIAGAWITLIDGGWLEIDGARARAGEGASRYAPVSEDPEGFSAFGHALLSIRLLGMYLRGGEEGGFTAPVDTLTALMYVCEGEGLDLPEPSALRRGEIGTVDGCRPPTDPDTGRPDRDELLRYAEVRRDLMLLAAHGVLEGDGDRVDGSAAVMLAVLDVTRTISEREL